LIAVWIDSFSSLLNAFSFRENETWVTTCAIAIFIIKSGTINVCLGTFVILVKEIPKRALYADFIIELVAVWIQ
jgi:hypothetical protein